MNKRVLIGTILAVFIIIIAAIGYNFYSQEQSIKRNLSLCLKVGEISFKEEWNKECSRLNLGWDCNLPEEKSNRALLKEKLQQETDKCYSKWVK